MGPENGNFPGGSPPPRVAVFRALQLGDLLCAVPALRAIRCALPTADIMLVGLPWARAFVDRFAHYLNGFCEFPGFPGLPEREPEIERIPEFCAAMQGERFDLLIQMHGSGIVTNPLCALLGARALAGFFLPGQYCPDPGRFLPYPDRGLEVDRLLELVRFLGFEPQGDELEFPIRDEDRRDLARLEAARGLEPRRFVCVHPGASTPARRWPVERFARVCDGLAAQGFGIVLTGTGSEASLTRPLAAACHAPVIDLAGRTTLGALAALLSEARLLVSNDTGVSHIAAALKTPSVIISTGNNPARWAPRDRLRHRVLCDEGGVGVREVLKEVHNLLHPRQSSVA